MNYELILLMKFIDGFHINDYTSTFVEVEETQ